MHDTIVIGGGPAGLQAALTLGRMHRTVLLLDSGSYRNGTAEAMHNFITHDGRDPAELRALARKDVAAYDTVEVREARADEVRRVGSTFEVVVGDDVLPTRSLILATGLRDTLPDVPGVAEAWGREVAHCPFCHGYELAGARVALLGAGPAASHVGALMAGLGCDLVALAGDGEVEPEQAEKLAALGVEVRPGRVRGIERVPSGLRVDVVGGEPLEVAGMFVAPTMSQATPFAERLGLDLLSSGCVEVDAMGRTGLYGVYAAGDMAHLAALPGPMSSVLAAAASGLVAGSVCTMDLAVHP